MASNADLDLFVRCGDVGKVESTVPFWEGKGEMDLPSERGPTIS